MCYILFQNLEMKLFSFILPKKPGQIKTVQPV